MAPKNNGAHRKRNPKRLLKVPISRISERDLGTRDRRKRQLLGKPSQRGPILWSLSKANSCEFGRKGAKGSNCACKSLRRDDLLAESEGFEPPVPFQAQRFSRPPVSTTHPALRWQGSCTSRVYFTLAKESCARRTANNERRPPLDRLSHRRGMEREPALA